VSSVSSHGGFFCAAAGCAGWSGPVPLTDGVALVAAEGAAFASPASVLTWAEGPSPFAVAGLELGAPSVLGGASCLCCEGERLELGLDCVLCRAFSF